MPNTRSKSARELTVSMISAAALMPCACAAGREGRWQASRDGMGSSPGGGQPICAGYGARPPPSRHAGRQRCSQASHLDALHHGRLLLLAHQVHLVEQDAVGKGQLLHRLHTSGASKQRSMVGAGMGGAACGRDGGCCCCWCRHGRVCFGWSCKALCGTPHSPAAAAPHSRRPPQSARRPGAAGCAWRPPR